MCLLAAIAGVWVVGSDNNIFTQIGLIVLIGLAAKNAILIVEFAKQTQDQGTPRFEAIIEAAKTRLRPILMTSFAFILGVLPLVTSAGAGSEMRFALGVAVFSGMLGVTLFGIFFTPVFYEVIRGRTDRRTAERASQAAGGHPTGPWRRDRQGLVSAADRREAPAPPVAPPRVQADEPGDEDGQVELAAHALDDREPARRRAQRHDVPVAERRDRHEAEVDGGGQVEHGAERSRPFPVEDLIGDAEQQADQEIGVERRQDVLRIDVMRSECVARPRSSRARSPSPTALR
jgi:multidrug efflux pump